MTMRLIVQSRTTGRFLCPCELDGQPVWVRSLADASFGVVTEPERAVQLVHDWADIDDEPMIIDLDLLGTEAHEAVCTPAAVPGFSG